MTSLEDVFGPPIHVTTRADLIRSGDLIAVPEQLARDAGWKVPVAVTAGVHADCVAWPADAEARRGFTGQDPEGRMWDVVYMARVALDRRSGTRFGDRVPFDMVRVPVQGRGRQPRRVTLHLVLNHGDEMGSVVATILLPTED